MKRCVRCNLTAERTCSLCFVENFCSQQCADEHWNIGKHAQDHNIMEEPNPMDLIVGSGRPGEGSVFLGNLHGLDHLDHIDAVVSALGIDYEYGYAKEKVVEADEKDGKKRHHLRITVWDSHDANIAEYFDLVADFIELHVCKGRHVFVHCVAGMSRSATLVLYYMHKYVGYNDLDRALEHVQKLRPIVRPNSSFMRQLERAYEEKF
jgi:protein tyrosine phosphatase